MMTGPASSIDPVCFLPLDFPPHVGEGIYMSYNWDRAPSLWERHRTGFIVTVLLLATALAGWAIF